MYGGREMEQTIVIGVHQFIGFHLTNKLLEKGKTVIGIDDSTDREDNEMDLYIGRNANYSFRTLDQLKEIKVSEETTVFIDWYDIQINRENCRISAEELTKVLQLWGEDKEPIVLVLCPIVQDSEETFIEWKRIKSEKIIYLPTVYGPWQPVTMSFAAAISDVETKELIRTLKNDYRLDAIFIDDVLNALPEIQKQEHQTIILESVSENQWAACAEELNTPELIETLTTIENRVYNEKAVYHKVNNSVTPKQGIALQIEHFEKMKRLSISE